MKKKENIVPNAICVNSTKNGKKIHSINDNLDKYGRQIIF